MQDCNKEDEVYNVVSDFIISIKSCNIDKIKRYLDEYGSTIVNKLQSQTRQPSLYFSVMLTDHEQSYDVMKMLLDNGAYPHFKDGFQQTVMYYVCKDGKKKCLQLLLDNEVQLNEIDVYGQTPIFYAAKQNQLNILPTLIASGANLNIKDVFGQTPLFYAAKEGHLEMCKCLVEGGCDLTILDTGGKMASQIAKKNNKIETYDYLNTQYNIIKDKIRMNNQINGDSAVNEQKNKQKKKKQLNFQVPKLQITKKNDKIQKNFEKVEKSLLNKSQKTDTYRLYKNDGYGNIIQVTVLEIQRLISGHPQLNDLLKRPEQSKATQAVQHILEQQKPKQSWLKVASRVLTICWKAKGAHFFHEAVDPIKFEVSDYFEIIKEPRDFGLIRKNLTNGSYSRMQDFAKDMNLVFDNCIHYNGVENSVAKHAMDIQKIYEQQMLLYGYTPRN